MPSVDSAAPLVFVSYSHLDRKPHLDRLEAHLKPLAREGLVDYWADTRIQSGEKWRPEIVDALVRARVAVLLVSANFYASDFIVKDELPPLLKKNARKMLDVLPVIVGASRFARDPILSRFQAVNDPTKPLDALRAPQRERMWDELARKVEQRVALSSAAKGVSMIDRMEAEIRSVVEGKPVRREHRIVVKPVGKTIVGTVAGKTHKTITAADLAKLPRKELMHIRTYERSMEQHYNRWMKLYSVYSKKSPMSPSQRHELQDEIKGMKRDLVGIISFLERLGLNLEDHYSHIRSVVQRPTLVAA